MPALLSCLLRVHFIFEEHEPDFARLLVIRHAVYHEFLRIEDYGLQK